MDFAEYVAARRPALIRSAVLLGCSPEEAEDVVQTSLVKCLRHWRRVSQSQRIDAYVYRALVNAFRDGRSRRWHGEAPTADLPEPPPADEDLVSGIAVRRALAALTKEHREVLVLRFYADLSERDTAQVLDVAPGTVKSRTARALAALSVDQNITGVIDAH